MNTLIPKTFWSLRLPSLFEDGNWPDISIESNGLSISEDEKNVYVGAAMPGLEPKDLTVSYEKGVLWLRGEKKEEEKSKTYFKKATTSFSYRTMLPVDVDETMEPSAQYKNGVCTVTFKKAGKKEAKTIQVNS